MHVSFFSFRFTRWSILNLVLAVETNYDLSCFVLLLLSALSYKKVCIFYYTIKFICSSSLSESQLLKSIYIYILLLYYYIIFIIQFFLFRDRIFISIISCCIKKTSPYWKTIKVVRKCFSLVNLSKIYSTGGFCFNYQILPV